MAVLTKCHFPILLLASLISLAAATRDFPLDIDDHSVSISASPPDDVDSISPTGIKHPRPPLSSKVDPDIIGFYSPRPAPKLDTNDDCSSISTMTTSVDGERDYVSKHASVTDEELELMDSLKDMGKHDSDGTSGDAMYGSSKWFNGWGHGWGWGNNGYNNGWGNGGNGYGGRCTGTCYGGVCSGTCYGNGGGGGWGWGRNKLAALDALSPDTVPPEAAKGNSPAAISEAFTTAPEPKGT